MLGKLLSSIRSTDPLIRLARRGDWTAFARALVDADVFVVSAPDGGFDMASMTEEEMVRQIERTAAAVSEATEFVPLTYEEKGRRYFPFFSHAKAAEEFCGAYASKIGQFIPMQMFGVKGSVVLQYRESADWIVFNDQSDESFDIPAAQLRVED